MSETLILAIETSCDETSAAVVTSAKGSVPRILSNVVASQIEIHRQFGGVVPEIASRNHVFALTPTVSSALKTAGITLNDVGAIAVTYGAGLLGALLTGVSYAKGLSYALNVPLIKVNHIHAHIAANFLQAEPPFICAVVSGGHTMVVEVVDYFNYVVLKETLDDAIGEAFDKVARVLGLPYPGGPEIDRLAKEGSATINFFKHSRGIDGDHGFSYSGLKTAVINYVHNKKQVGEPLNLADICASFQCAAVQPLVDYAVKQAVLHRLPAVTAAGGVSANSFLTHQLTTVAAQNGITALVPPLALCTDNAAMVGIRAALDLPSNRNLSPLTLTAQSVL